MITIRQMELDDLDAVMEIENAVFSTPWTETGFFTFLIREDALFLVACEDDSVIGYCGVVMAADEGDITNVAVDVSHRRRGAAEMLIRELIRHTLERGVTKLFLEVRESNMKARALYEKMGFEQNGRRKHYYEAPAEDAILMCRMDKSACVTADSQ